MRHITRLFFITANVNFSFDGDADAHNRHRQMNNLSVKRCREKKKKDHEALKAGFKQQEEDLKKAKAEIETLKRTNMRLEAAVQCPPNINSNKDLVSGEIRLHENNTI